MQRAYELLSRAYGPQHWWPADTKLEIVVGAVLVQNTAWRNVERAITNLNGLGLDTLDALHAIDADQLAEAIRPAGYFRVKARRLRNLTTMIVERYGGSLDKMLKDESNALRAALLGVNGVGPETADAILCYAAERPVFVADAYGKRVLERHGWLPHGSRYDDQQRLVEEQMPPDTQTLNELHALIVNVGKLHCGPKPRCEGCPLAPMLPPSGAIINGEPAT
ncbi:endonuclease III domain-containing protein [Pseudobythopirellula maris]|nr:endonuclease III domain-containing protein [Pseudobythopirellula maris]